MKKILVIRLGAIGDVILATPALLNLKLSFPKAEISLLTRADLSGLAEMFAGIDKVLPFPRRASAQDLFRMGEYLDNQNYDLIIDLHGNIRSFYLMRHVTAGAKIRYDKRWWGRLKAIKFDKINHSPPHTIDLYNSAVEKAGGRVYARRPAINLAFNRPRQLLFDKSKKTIALAPGASYVTKQWPKKNFYDLAIELNRRVDCNIVLVLTSKESELGILADILGSNNIQVFRDAKLEKLAAVFSESDLIISNDSAMAHLGSAVGTPVMAIFGPTHPTLGFAPRGLKDIVIEVDEPCRPCSKHGKKRCFREEQFCFTRIGVESVFEKIHGLINDFPGEKAIFIDRDGTLIKEKNFLSTPLDVEPEEGAIDALKIAQKAGYKLIVISNQSGVARGYFDEETVLKINRQVFEIFSAAGIKLDDFYYCPHLKGAKVERYNVDCACRKPAPGMIEAAALRHNINPFKSFVIGDKLADVALGFVSGCKSILVLTGYGLDQAKLMQEERMPRPEKVLQNLAEGVEYMVGKLNKVQP